MEPMTVTVGQSFRLPASTFTYEDSPYGYLPTSKWSTAADDSGQVYSGVVLPDELPGSTAGGTVTLYAQWEPTYGLIAFDLDGGTPAEGVTFETMQISSGEEKYIGFASTDMVKEGYVAMGWQLDGDAIAAGAVLNGGITIFPSGEFYVKNVPLGKTVTLRPIWEPA